ncbi:MAG: MFS transporter [Chloroflexota bacterium]|nr:MFS transporter [Chloroflexota bacterium]
MSEAETAENQTPLSRRRRFLALTAVVVVVFLAALDLSALRLGLVGDVIGPVYPGEDSPAGAWAVVVVYFVAWIVSLPLWGKLSDVYGRRRLWLVGLALFTAASAGSLTSQELIQLTISRFLQGLGVGAIFALGPALIGDLNPPSSRAKWQGALVALLGVGLLGWVTLVNAVAWIVVNIPIPVMDSHYFFLRWSLLLNLPIGILAILASCLGLPAVRTGIRRRVDVAGAMAFVATIVPVLVTLKIAGRLFPWPSAPTFILLAGALVILAVLVFAVRRIDNPFINLRLLTHRSFLVSAMAMFVAGIGLAASLAYAPHFVRPGEAFGTRMDLLAQQAAMVAAFAVGAVVAGQLVARIGSHKVLVLALMLIATASAVLFSRMHGTSTQFDVVRNSAISGLAFGGLLPVLVLVVQNACPRRNLGELTGGILFLGFLGFNSGFGILAQIASAWYRANVQAGAAQLGSDPLISAEISLQTLNLSPDAAGGLAADVLREGWLDALNGAFVIVAVLLAVAFVLVALLREAPTHTATDTDSDESGVAAPAGGGP